MRVWHSLLILLASALPAFAGETPWQAMAPGVSARLISSDVLGSDGRTMIALQLDMSAGTKTYWKVPGESGIPTEISPAPRSAAPEIFWPYPKVDRGNGVVDFAYYGPLVLPMAVSGGEGQVLGLTASMGICSDICVPASASFSLPLQFARPDTGQGLRIRQAMADVPLPWTAPGAPIGEVRWNPAGDGLLVSLADNRADPLSLIASAADDGLSFGAPQKSPEPNLVLLPLLGNNTRSGTGPRNISLIFMTAEGPYEVKRRVIVASGAAAQ